jgi:hypothetical protein
MTFLDFLDLKERGYSIVLPEPEKDTKAEEAIKYLESVGKIKDGKIVV